MPSTLDEYREAKSHYLKLRNQAKKELVARFNELASEMLQIQRELLEDFGEKVAMPSKPKKARPKPPGQPAKAGPPAPVPPPAPAAPSPKLVQLGKQLAKQKSKLSEAQTAGKPTKAIEDRIYEIEDEMRLLQA